MNLNDTFNCWFCKSQLTIPPNREAVLCRKTNSCQSHRVQFSFWTIHDTHREDTYINQAEFQFYLTNKDYSKAQELFVYYDNMRKQCRVVERITPPFDPEDESVSVRYSWKELLKVPYSSIILTPENFKDKFKTYLLFS